MATRFRFPVSLFDTRRGFEERIRGWQKLETRKCSAISANETSFILNAAKIRHYLFVQEPWRRD